MTDSSPRFGFVAFAGTWNGRLATPSCSDLSLEGVRFAVTG